MCTDLDEFRLNRSGSVLAILWVLTATCYLLGTAIIGLLVAVALGGQPGAAVPVGAPRQYGQFWIALFNGLGLIAGGLVGQTCIRRDRRVSVATAGAALTVKPAWGRSYSIPLSEIAEIRASQHWLLGSRIRIRSANGTLYAVPSNLRAPLEFTRRVVDGARLAVSATDGRWTVHRRGDASGAG